MDARTIEAIHKSINHWNLTCYGVDNQTGPGPCALCQMFNDGTGCGKCPLNEFEGKKCSVTGSDPSFYGRYVNNISWDNENFCTVDSANEAEAMLETLVGLLPELGERIKLKCNSEQAKYRAYLPDDPDDKYYIFNGADYIYTGITTDGRNRHPKAEEVWRKVFERQRDAKLYKYADDCGKALGDSLNNCPTCGQEVKRKVTKYKIVFIEHGLLLQTNCYYVDKADFESNHRHNPSSEFIGLIKSTAKEFEV